MNEKEASLLQELISKDEQVLEMGCGAGRLIGELAIAGYAVSGCDYAERHVQITKENLEKRGLAVAVTKEDWKQTSLGNESFDTVYSLGRNILHDYSLLDQAQLFREAARILRPGGKFIFDIPDRGKGGYGKMVEGYAEEMRKRGINNFRYGAIYDSPDNEHFATRYAYSHEDITELAKLSGFEIFQVRKEELATGQGDENLYFVLKKKADH
ncbi:MAG: class I SAM-dependent methyltransferase [Candidatus Moraniibacteriota bacterium]